MTLDSAAHPLSEQKARPTLIAIAVVAGLAELAYAVMNISAMPVYLKFSMHYGEFLITAIGIAFLFFEGVMKGPFGVMGDHIGRKWLIIVGPLISVFTALLTMLVPPEYPWLFACLRVLDGLGAAALWPSALAMIADVIPESKRAQAMSLFNVTYLIGIALGPLIGGISNDLTGRLTVQVREFMMKSGPHFIKQRLLTHAHDPRTASFYVVAVLFGLTAIVAWWRLPNIQPHHIHQQSEMEQGFSFSAMLHSLKQIPEMLALAFITFFGIGMIMFIIKLFALAEFNLSETQFGALLMVPALIIACASVPLGTIGDKIGKARAVHLGMGICAFSLLLMILIKNEFALVIGGSINGVGFVISFPSWMAFVSQSCHPRQRGAVMGAVGTAQGLGAMSGALVGGWTYEHVKLRVPGLPWINGHYTPFIGCMFMLFLAWVFSMLTIRDAASCRIPDALPASDSTDQQ